jgi:DNA damage-inducible protein 1
MDMLLGLDMLKRHQCVIDLQKNVLIFGSANIETKFLPESELPGHARPGNEEIDDVTAAIEESKKTPATTSASTSSEFQEAVITNLMNMGASRSDVIEALKLSNGDQSQAQIKLLAKMLQSPSKK